MLQPRQGLKLARRTNDKLTIMIAAMHTRLPSWVIFDRLAMVNTMSALPPDGVAKVALRR